MHSYLNITGREIKAGALTFRAFTAFEAIGRNTGNMRGVLYPDSTEITGIRFGITIEVMGA